jgi:hypothetical protein
MGIKTQIKAKELESSNQFNISLLGFKMAITEGLTVFNLIDGIVDEFQDESGVDNSASTTLLYNSTDDYYINSTAPDGITIPAVSAGFTTTSITEPDTSTAGTNPAVGSGTFGTFTVPSGKTSINAFTWGSGGGGITTSTTPAWALGGGGGFSTGTLAVTPGQVIAVVVGEGGSTIGTTPLGKGGRAVGPAPQQSAGSGGGLSGLFVAPLTSNPGFSTAPQAYIVAGSGGGLGHIAAPLAPQVVPQNIAGGAGGGLSGDAGDTFTEQTSNNNGNGGGGSQSQGGQGGTGPQAAGQNGGLFTGGNSGTDDNNIAGGGSGYYGGAGASYNGAPRDSRTGGGGSSFYGHPQITSGSTEEGTGSLGGGTANPNYVAGTNEGPSTGPGGENAGPTNASGEDGYILITAAGTCASVTSSTIISDPFTANVVPTASRIVVFEENVGTPTLNTDVIASVSRNNGSNFTTVTLTDSGYVTGSSGQRILTGQADISGQPSGQSMKWKLQLANQTVKIHGVSLQWS